MQKLVDISTYQGDVDFEALKNSGVVGVFAKATEGLHEVDDRFAQYHDAAKAAGMPFGAYHFFHFGEDPVAQAKHFLSTTDSNHGTILPMVDVEGGGQDCVTDVSTLIHTLSTFLVEVEKTLNGKKVIIYADYGSWSGFMQGTDAFSGHPFFVAEYNNDAQPTLPAGFSRWVLWQHTDADHEDGISGNVDGDYLNGNLSAILR